MSVFDKSDKCESVKIWSREKMTNDMFLFGWTAFNSYNKGLESGDVSERGCVYSNKFYSALAIKTKAGMCSVCVSVGGVDLS